MAGIIVKALWRRVMWTKITCILSKNVLFRRCLTYMYLSFRNLQRQFYWLKFVLVVGCLAKSSSWWLIPIHLNWWIMSFTTKCISVELVLCFFESFSFYLPEFQSDKLINYKCYEEAFDITFLIIFCMSYKPIFTSTTSITLIFTPITFLVCLANLRIRSVTQFRSDLDSAPSCN